MANQFSVEPANPMAALMMGVQGYDRGAKATKDAAISTGRQEAMSALQSGADPSTALARLIAAGDIEGAGVVVKMHESQNAQSGFYGNPVYIQDPNSGEIRVGSFNKKMDWKDLNLPQGFSPTVPISYKDTATGLVPVQGRGVPPSSVLPGASQPSPRLPQQGAASPPPGFAPPAIDINSEGIPRSQADRVNAPQVGSTAPIQPTAVPTQSVRPGFIPKDLEGKEAQEAAGKRIGETMQAASRAPQALANLNRASALLNQVETGKLLPAQITVGAWGRAIGISDDNLKNMGLNPAAPAVGQAAQSLFNEIIIGKLGPGGFPTANFSNTDLKFITGTVMQLGDEPAANKIRIETARRIEQQKIEKANQWREFKKANPRASFDDFETGWNNRALQKDMFGDLAAEAEALIANAMPQTPNQRTEGGWQVIDGVKMRPRN